MDEQEQPLKIKKLARKALIIVISIWIVNLIIYFFLIDDNPGQLGDVFGAANALFSGLALAGIVITLFMQRYEIKLQQNELILQREELTETRGVFEKQTDLMLKQQNDNTFFNLLQNYREVVESLKIGNKKSLGRSKSFNLSTGHIEEEISGYKVIEGLSHNWNRTLKDYISMNDTSVLNGFKGVEHPFVAMKNSHIAEILVDNITNILKFIDSRFDENDKGFYRQILTSSLSVNEIFIYEMLVNNNLTNDTQFQSFFGYYDSYGYSGIEKAKLPKYFFNDYNNFITIEVPNNVKIKAVGFSDLNGKKGYFKITPGQTEIFKISHKKLINSLTSKSKVLLNNWAYLLFKLEFEGKEFHLPIEFHLERIHNIPTQYDYRIRNIKSISNSEKIDKLMKMID